MTETSKAGLGWFDAQDTPDRIELRTCIHCGLCLTACPTYRTLKIEPDSPRGRLYLMRGLSEGRIAPSDPLLLHLDQCLDCRACETVCPAGVPYGRLLEQTRAQLGRRAQPRTPLRHAAEWVLRHVFPARGRMHLLADLLRLGQVGPGGALMRRPAVRRALPRFARQGLAMTPALLPRAERAIARVALPPGARLERHDDGLLFRPAGNPKKRVAFFQSCVMEVMYPELDRLAVRMLLIAGCEVAVPRGQTCCGALHAHAGLRPEAKKLARTNAGAFGARFDYVVTDSAGCGAALREAGHLLADETAADEAVAFSSRVRDVSEVLAEVGMPRAESPLASGRDAGKPLRIGYHDPCHLAHAQKVRNAPRQLLRALPGVELVDLPNSDWCCGSAGVYNLTHPELADAQLAQKLDAIAKVAPEVVVASNPGCMLHMARGAKERGMELPMLHLVEVLGRAWPSGSR